MTHFSMRCFIQGRYLPLDLFGTGRVCFFSFSGATIWSLLQFISLLYGRKFHFDLPCMVYDVETSENLF